MRAQDITIGRRRRETDRQNSSNGTEERTTTEDRTRIKWRPINDTATGMRERATIIVQHKHSNKKVVRETTTYFGSSRIKKEPTQRLFTASSNFP